MSSAELKPGYERVHTVLDYYDGPRKGVADFEGQPLLYDCISDEAKGNYSNAFLLMPIDTESFRSALEDWEIWQRWELAYHTGKADLSTHPALPKERKRHDELQAVLQNTWVIDPKKSITRLGHFEPVGNEPSPVGVMRQSQVKWSERA
jgi:hypothetical protein